MRFMKQWWLETETLSVDGQQLIFKGWINTMHDVQSKNDITSDITGKFWGYVDEEGMHGGFVLDDPTLSDKQCEPGAEGKDGNWLVGNFYPGIQLVMPDGGLNGPVEFCRSYADAFLQSHQPVKCQVQPFERRIEDCLKLEHTHVITL